jgi:hypothetical protein
MLTLMSSEQRVPAPVGPSSAAHPGVQRRRPAGSRSVKNLALPAGGQARADDLVAAWLSRAWRRISAGAGARPPASTTGPGSRSGSAGSRAEFTGCWPAGRSATRPRLPTTSLRAPPSNPGRPGLDRRGQVAYRGMLPAGQERSRPGSLPGPDLAGCAHITLAMLTHARLAVSRHLAAKGEPTRPNRA